MQAVSDCVSAFFFMHIVRAELLLGGFWFHRNWSVASAQSLARVGAHGPKCAYMRVDRQSPTCNFSLVQVIPPIPK